MASAEAKATAIRMLVCARQSASAAPVVVAATITIGNLASAREATSRSSPSIGLVRREVLWASSNTCCWLAGPVMKF